MESDKDPQSNSLIEDSSTSQVRYFRKTKITTDLLSKLNSLSQSMLTKPTKITNLPQISKNKKAHLIKQRSYSKKIPNEFAQPYLKRNFSNRQSQNRLETPSKRRKTISKKPSKVSKILYSYCLEKGIMKFVSYY